MKTSATLMVYVERGSLSANDEASATSTIAVSSGHRAAAGSCDARHSAQTSAAAPVPAMASQAASAGAG